MINWYEQIRHAFVLLSPTHSIAEYNRGHRSFDVAHALEDRPRSADFCSRATSFVPINYLGTIILEVIPMLMNKRALSVEFGHCDPSGIVYNPNYFIWFDMSVHALLARGGLSLKEMMAEFGIDGIPVVEYKCKFLAPARWADELLLETSVVTLHRCAFDIQHHVFNAGVLAAECLERRVCTAVDPLEGRVKARTLPEKLVDIFNGRGADTEQNKIRDRKGPEPT